jgi:hypothetical protein
VDGATPRISQVATAFSAIHLLQVSSVENNGSGFVGTKFLSDVDVDLLKNISSHVGHFGKLNVNTFV